MKTKKLLHINSYTIGSTGSIMYNLSRVAEEKGYKSFVAYPPSRTNYKRNMKNNIHIGSRFDRNLHLKLTYYTGLHGCYSIRSTKRFLKQVDMIKPDIIHLHNLHNSYINLKMLFEFIKEKKISVVWTLHDCWAFTGHCTHFTVAKCQKWQTECYECPLYKEYPATRIDKSQILYNLKKEWFTSVENLTIVTPSKWLADRVQESFLRKYPVKVINNGIDLTIFRPTPSDFKKKYKLNNKKILLGVASNWGRNKGLNIFYELAKRISNNYKIVLVGLTQEQLKDLPKNIIGLPSKQNPQELVEIYSAADLFINPSLEETMGLVTVESLACGTPVIVSNFTAVPEAVDSKCGIIVKKYDVDSFLEAINLAIGKFSREDCLNQANKYDLKLKYKEYLDLYNSIYLKQKK